MSSIINSEEIARDVIVIGASSGGFKAVIELLALLPASLPAIIGVVIHRSAAPAVDWSHTLQRLAQLRVVEPADGEPLTRGVVYVAPADRHMTFEGGHAHLDQGPRLEHTRPAADSLFASAALAYGNRVVAVVLTGKGQDGSSGLQAISEAGGLSLVQAPSEAPSPSMPLHAIANDHVIGEFTLRDLGPALIELVHGRVVLVAGKEHLAAT